MICPRCGNDQPIAPECSRCGVIFERMHTLNRPRVVLPEPAPTLPLATVQPPLPDVLRSAWQNRPAPLRHRQAFFVQLARMLQAGVPLEEALQRIGDVVGSGAMGQTARAMAGHIREGLSLSAAMDRHDVAFDEVERAVVAAAEHTGDLPRAANRLAARVEEARKTRRVLLGGAAYPAFLVTMSILTQALPALVLRGAGAFASEIWLPATLWLTVLVLGLLVLPAVLARPAVRSAILDALVSLPLLPMVLRNRRYALAFDVLAQALDAGLPLARCLELGCRASGESQMQVAGKMVALAVDKGASLADAAVGLPDLDAASRATIAAGERTGHLPETFAELAAERARIWQSQLKLAVGALGVAMTLAAAAFIGYSLVQQFQATMSGQVQGIPETDLRDLQRALGPELFKGPDLKQLDRELK